MLAIVLLTFGKFIAIHFYHSPALVRYLPLFALMMLFGIVNGFYGKVLAGYRDIKLRTWIVNFVGSPAKHARRDSADIGWLGASGISCRSNS